MVCPSLISVSLAPWSYFFCAFAGAAGNSATHAADVRRPHIPDSLAASSGTLRKCDDNPSICCFLRVLFPPSLAGSCLSRANESRRGKVAIARNRHLHIRAKYGSLLTERVEIQRHPRENVMELKSKFVDVAGTRTRYHELGEGEPTILIHGGGPGASGVSNYRKNIEPLSARRRAIVIDLLRFRETEGQLDDVPVFPAMGDFVRDFMDVIGVGKASFVGNSMGGATSFIVAFRAPARVNKLVLMGTGGSPAIFSPMPTEGLR